MPCFRAFIEEAALPSAERGPVDFCALARLAAIWAGVAMTTRYHESGLKSGGRKI